MAQHDNARLFYPWHQYSFQAIRQGILALWDPYSFSGRIYMGEMQPGVFYPLNLLMFLSPADRRGRLPLEVMEGFLILGHFLAAGFMFQLARRLGLSRWAAAPACLSA